MSDDVVTDRACFSVYSGDGGNGLTLYVDTDGGAPQSAPISLASIEAHLRGWDWSEIGYVCAEDFRGSFGIDPGLVPATGEHEGPFVVWCEPNYYDGTFNAPSPSLDKDEEGDVIVFASYEEAAEYVAAYYNAPSRYEGIPACNVLAHGQAGTDSLTICKYGKGTY